MHTTRLTSYLVLTALAVAVLVSLAPATSSVNRPAPAVIIDLDAVAAEIAPRKTLSGSYLAARYAQRHQDWDTAQAYMFEVTEQDPGNVALMQRAFLLALGAGHYDRAKTLAEKIADLKEDSDLALIFLAADDIHNKNYQAALKHLAPLPEDGFGQFTKPLLSAWATVGLGKTEEAIEILDARTPDKDPTFNTHAGLMKELAGDKVSANSHYLTALESGVEMHAALMISNFYERDGKADVANGIAEGLDKFYSFHPFVSSLNARKGKVLQAEIKDAAGGASLALFDLAALLHSKGALESAKVYASMAAMLNPRASFVKAMLADIEAQHRQFQKSIAYYEDIASDAPIYWLSRVRVAEVYDMAGDRAQAVHILTGLSQQEGMRLIAFSALGDLYRRHEMNLEAVHAYDDALNSAQALSSEHWTVIYARGLARAEMKDWMPAEKDIMQALSFQPKNPMILNFLAYTWAEQGINLDRALDYVRQAAAIKPDDGYILDSYGWTLFRMQKYQEAIAWLERAVESVPGDSTLLSHLGDAYWMSGRKNEARYQWRQAKDLSTNPAFRASIQEKMRNGLAETPAIAAHEQAKL